MLNLESIMNESIAWGKIFIPKLFIAIIILIVGWWLSKVISKSIKHTMNRTNVDKGVISFVYSILITTFRTLVIITVIAELGVNVTSIVTAVGAAGVTAGLALKSSLSNIASGLLILITKPFKIGDYLEFDQLEGTVVRIEMMFTTLKTYDNKAVIIPNSQLTEQSVINYTQQKTRRLDLKYSVSYDSDIKSVKELLYSLVLSNDKALDNPKPFVAVAEHSPSSIDMVVKFWCKIEDYWDLYYEMQEKVKIEFDKHNITIPFNQLDVNIKK